MILFAFVAGLTDLALPTNSLSWRAPLPSYARYVGGTKQQSKYSSMDGGGAEDDEAWNFHENAENENEEEEGVIDVDADNDVDDDVDEVREGSEAAAALTPVIELLV